MVIDFLKHLYKSYKREKFLEKRRYLFSKDTEYVLFSGTALEDDGDVRHLNDLYFMLFLLKKYNISKSDIILSVDKAILKELKINPNYDNAIYKTITNLVDRIINPETFQEEYTRKN